MERNKIILIGGSHHNGLGLARTFGINGITPYGVIVGEGANKSFIRKSKYWAKTWGASNNEEAIELIMREFADEAKKPVIIPWSDGAEEAIDRNLDKLKEKFIVPSLGGKQNAVVKLMDKQNQVVFAEKYNLPIAKSWTVSTDENNIPSDIIYPCIIKPVISCEGQKSDIEKCQNAVETLQYLEVLKEKGYQRILIQEFLNFDYEFEFVGCCCEVNSYLVSRNVRTWPIVGGTNSFFQCITDKDTLAVCNRILDALKAEGYCGVFDIELFYVKGEVYLNEVNWRNTGNSFFNIGTGVYYPVIWYLNVIGEDTTKFEKFCGDTEQYAMNESTDLRHVVYGKIPLAQWNTDRKKTQSFALWYAPDLKPTLAQYRYLMFEMLRRGKSRKDKKMEGNMGK